MQREAKTSRKPKRHLKKSPSKPRSNINQPRQIEGATTIPRAEHPVSRNHFSPNALKVLYRLKDNGYDAYLVGGCIRDVLLGIEPKDFDVVTNATPEQVKECFNNCRLIGRRFRLAHVVFGREIIEVATFRGHHEPESNTDTDSNDKKVSKQSTEGQLLRDNVFGSIEEDAERRDFTINALYYSINDYAIYDFANGMESIEQGLIDLIGDPDTRYREDPVRMLRAVRFSNKLRMKIAPRTEAPIFELAHLLRNIPPARLFDEFLKLFMSGKAQDNFHSLKHYGLFKYYFPVVEQVLSDNSEAKELRMLEQMCANTDLRINAEQSVSPAFILAVLLWYPLEAHAKDLELESGLHPYDAFQIAMNDILHRAIQTVAIPKRFSATMRDIWQFQHRLTKIQGKRPTQLIEHPKFRAAYDFLLLRAEIEGGELEELADWWTNYQESDEGKRIALTRQKAGASTKRSPRSRPRSNSAKPKRRSYNKKSSAKKINGNKGE
ncbi:MAG: polynucleotide adenylyltransferase PcnB [Gammaproteobacteria bacterium]|nr:polynucleotide adenylyltransferase PcnB [Gammaproteobacteria bacterium]